MIMECLSMSKGTFDYHFPVESDLIPWTSLGFHTPDPNSSLEIPVRKVIPGG